MRRSSTKAVATNLPRPTSARTLASRMCCAKVVSKEYAANTWSLEMLMRERANLRGFFWGRTDAALAALFLRFGGIVVSEGATASTSRQLLSTHDAIWILSTVAGQHIFGIWR